MRSDRERLEDILEMCRLIHEQVSGRRERLAADPVLQAAAQRWIGIIGEAAANVSSELRNAHPEVSWAGAIGMRQILIHGYFHMDLDVVWEVVERDAPALQAQVERILAELG